MSETRVRYSKRDGPVELPIRFLGPDQNFVLRSDAIAHRMSANIPPRLLDLLEIASAVFCADSTVPRGGLTQPRHGETWRRDLDLTFAVRDLSFWQGSDATRLLRDCIEFMTDDQVSCRFVQSEQPPPIQSYLDLTSANEDAFQIDDVILFSGGLDSLTGTLETLATTDRRVALVTHRSAPKTIHHQDQLIEAIEKKFKERFLWIPIYVHRKGKRASESTQRSRSLLFTALGGVVAQMLGASGIKFFENGVVSQNLPLARPIVGTLATRTTHPQTLNHLEDLLSHVAEKPMKVRNPFEWMSKTEVVRNLVQNDAASLLPLTVSCNHTFKRTSNARHCGCCTQCLDRRFAVLSNGLEHAECKEDYAIDILLGTRARDDHRALAIEWVRNARRMSEMTSEEFQMRFMNELLRIGRAFGDREQAMERCHDLHRRHGLAVATVLQGLDASEVAAAPPGSIASVLGGKRQVPKIAQDAPDVRESQDEAESRAVTQSEVPVLEIVKHHEHHVSLLGFHDFNRTQARLVCCLLDVFIEDRTSELPRAKYRTLKAREIADRMNVSEDYVRTEVKRIRKNLAETWQAVFGTAPPRQILIKTIGKHGYRLDLDLNVVSAEHSS